MKYLILGASGMAGHLITIYLKEQGEVVDALARRKLSFSDTIVLDITDFSKLEAIIKSNNYDYIINCIGILNTSAENNRANTILINSYLPHFLQEKTRSLKTRIIHMSTDCVFSGDTGHYSENAIPDGESFYARTKALGELNDTKNLTFRNSIIGPDINDKGIGLLNWFLKQTGEINGYTKSIWNGVTTLTLAKAIHSASYNKISGLYNLVNNEVTNKYELLLLFKKYSNKNIIINKVDGVDHDKSLYNTRDDFSFIVPSFEDQIRDMFEWIKMHINLYSYDFTITKG